MFRKPKRAPKSGLRRRQADEPEDAATEAGDDVLKEELREARKKAKTSHSASSRAVDMSLSSSSSASKAVLHQYETTEGRPSAAELATSTTQLHPTQAKKYENKSLAGPLRAPTNIRTTCRFDYQPDICKDYKETGFCGFGDTCIYLHDRGDTLSGWQLEQKWQDEQRQKKEKQEKQMQAFLDGKSKGDNDDDAVKVDDDGLPFACFICRSSFTDPVVTTCNHYFCEKCIMDHVKSVDSKCPVCSKNTHSVFNQPTKLIAKRRKTVGPRATWEDFYSKLSNRGGDTEEYP